MNKFLPADILLPKKDFQKWAVIACDQYTSEKDYWDKVEQIVGDSPSALKITLPEIYLEDGNTEERIASVNANMKNYLENGVFEEFKNKMIYVERVQSDGAIRHGIVGKIELADYDYRKGSSAAIRSTEETVLERIPPRVKIRKDAPLELPHVLMLANDAERKIIESFADKKNEMQMVYDFDLMQGGGHITAWLLSDEDADFVGAAFTELGVKNGGMMFAVGDGNHSLASAKECSIINPEDAAKYALVEVVNIHDEAIQFEPIYRVLFGTDPKTVIDDMKNALGECDDASAQKFLCVYKDGEEEVSVNATSKLPVGTLQKWLDKYIAEKNIKIDYIHGTDSVRKLCSEENRIGFIFDGMKKEELFEAVEKDGSLPRKTFSMGHAADKRYYIEARKIK